MSTGGGLFNVSEIVQMAIDEEHNGYFFYNALADCADSPKLQETARRLAEQEKYHEKRFIEMRDRLGAYQPPEQYPGEYADYVNVLVGGRVFPDEEGAVKLAQEAGGDADAVDTAILFEKNTLLFLNEMRTLVPEKDRQTIDELTDEERQHLVDLSAVRGELA
ncbi:MAG: ferritin-like domain-containing protein [Candidatus Brocadiia bacterium]